MKSEDKRLSVSVYALFYIEFIGITAMALCLSRVYPERILLWSIISTVLSLVILYFNLLLFKNIIRKNMIYLFGSLVVLVQILSIIVIILPGHYIIDLFVPFLYNILYIVEEIFIN